MKQRQVQTVVLAALAVSGLSACGYGWQRESNQYPPSSANAQTVQGTAISSPLLPDEYVVQPGDSVYGIAARKGLLPHDLAGWNNLGQDYLIVPGQLLRLSPPASRTPVSAAAGSVPYPANESSASMQAVPLPSRRPVGAPVPLPPSQLPSPPAAVTEAATRPPRLTRVIEAPVFAPAATQPEPSSVPVIAPALPDSVIAPNAQSYPIVPLPAGSSAQARPLPSKRPADGPMVVMPQAAPIVAGAATLPPLPQIGTKPAAPAAANAVSAKGWRWPVIGTVVKSFAPANGSKGVDVSVDLGTPVRAAAAGRVAYSGSALKGYGELIVIKHDEVYLTAYGYNRKRLVKEGEQVKAGQVIAESGIGPDQNTVLHFEIREKGNPVDPIPFLPPL
jgi:lipoprotein NlpD